MSTRTPAFYHLCICVSDLERSLRFYCDGLGFSRNENFRIGSDMAPLIQLEGEVALSSVYLGLSGVRLELWHFEQPAAAFPRPARAPTRTDSRAISFMFWIRTACGWNSSGCRREWIWH